MVNKPKRTGPNAKKNQERVQKLILSLQNGLQRDSACVVSKIPRRTFYERMEFDDFRTKIEDAEEFWMSIVEEAKNMKIREGYRPAIEKELSSKRRDVYGERKHIEHSGDLELKDILLRIQLANEGEDTAG